MTQTRSIRETNIVIRENINWWIVIKGFLTLIKYRSSDRGGTRRGAYIPRMKETRDSDTGIEHLAISEEQIVEGEREGFPFTVSDLFKHSLSSNTVLLSLTNLIYIIINHFQSLSSVTHRHQHVALSQMCT